MRGREGGMQWAGTVSQSGRCDDFFFRFFQPPGAVVLFPLSLLAFHSFQRLSYFTQDKSAVTVETRSHCARARCAHSPALSLVSRLPWTPLDQPDS